MYCFISHFPIFTKVHFRTCAFFSILFIYLFFTQATVLLLKYRKWILLPLLTKPKDNFDHIHSQWLSLEPRDDHIGHVCIEQKRACSSFRSWPIFQRLERLWLIFISALEWLLWVLDEWASLLWNATCAARVTAVLKPDWSLQEQILLTGSSRLLSFVSPFQIWFFL